MEPQDSPVEMEQSKKALRSLTQTLGWRILEDRLEKLWKHKGMELAARLRQPDSNISYDSVRIQGYLDGLMAFRSEVRKMSQVENEVNPSY